jgi:hypothetical protein
MSTISAGTTSTTTLQASGDTAGTLVFKTNDTGSGGTTAMTIDTSQKVGVGTASPDALLTVNTVASFGAGAAGAPSIAAKGDLDTGMWFPATNTMAFSTNGTERMRINSSGTIWKNYTTDIFTASAYEFGLAFAGNSEQGFLIKNTDNSQNGAAIRFVDYLGNYSGGGIYYTSSNSINYATSSDYRLKQNIQPMINALAKVSQLKPCTFTWITDGASGQGFIAHELQEVVPEAVVGKKDAVNDDGSPRYQAVDTSFLITTLTAAIQELNAKVTALETELKALKAQS